MSSSNSDSLPQVGDVVFIFNLNSARGASFNMCCGFVEEVRNDQRRVVRPFTTFHTSPTGPEVMVRLALGREPVALRLANLKKLDFSDRNNDPEIAQFRHFFVQFLTYEGELWDKRPRSSPSSDISINACFNTPIGLRSTRAVEALHKILGRQLRPTFKFHLAHYRYINQGLEQNNHRALEQACTLFTELLEDLPKFSTSHGFFESQIRKDLAGVLIGLKRPHSALEVVLSMRSGDNPKEHDLPFKLLVKVSEELRNLDDDCERIALDEMLFMDDRSVFTHFRLGQFYLKKGKRSNAHVCFNRTLECDKLDPEILTDESRLSCEDFIRTEPAPDFTGTVPESCFRHLEPAFEVPLRAELRPRNQ